MSKNFKLIISVVCVFAVTLVLNYVTSIEKVVAPISYFITEDVEIISYSNFNAHVSSGYLEESKEGALQFAELMPADESEDLEEFRETYEDMVKNINDIVLLVENLEFENIETINDIKSVLVVDFKSSLANLYLKKYFSKIENDIYLLKEDDVKEKLAEALANFRGEELSDEEVANLEAFLADMEVVVKEIEGRFVFALDRDYLNEYASKVSIENSENELTLKFAELSEKAKLDIFIADSGKIIDRYGEQFKFNDIIEKLDYLTVYTDYKDGEVQLSLASTGAGKLFDMLDSSELTERKLSEYLAEDFTVYFANNSFETFFRELNSEMAARYGVDYSFIASMLIGGDPFEAIGNLGDELVLNINKPGFGAVVNTKDSSMVSGLLKAIGLPEKDGVYQMRDMTLQLKDDKLFLNENGETKSNNINFENLSLYSKIDLDFIMKTIDKGGNFAPADMQFFKPEFFVYAKKDEINIKIEMLYSELLAYIIASEKLVQAQ